MATLRELITKISFDVKTAPLERVAKSIDAIRSRLDLMIGIEAINGIAALSDRFGNFALDIRNTAAAAGITTDEFQKLTYAAAQAGVSQEEMGKTLTGLSKKLQEARLGSEEAALAFARANVTPEQLGSFRDAEQALYAVGRGLNSIQDPVLRASAAVALLGENNAKLMGSMHGGAKGLYALAHSAEAAQSALNPGMLDSLIASEQATIAMKSAFTTLTAQMLSAFAPVITSVVQSVTRFIQTLYSVGGVSWDKFIYNIGYAMGFAKGVLEDVSLVIIQTVRYIDEWGKRSGLWGAIKSGFEAIGKAAVWAYDQIVLAMVDVVNITTNLAEGAADAWEMITKAVQWASKRVDDFNAVIQKIDLTHIADGMMAMTSILLLLGGPQLAAVTATFGLIIGLIKTMVDLLHGVSFKDTWLGETVEAVKSFPGMIGKFLGLSDGSAVSQDGRSQASAISVPMAQSYADVPMQNVQSMMAMSRPPQAMQQATGPVAGPQDPSTRVQMTTNAPVTINITGAADSKPVLEAVRLGIADHHEAVLSQAKSSIPSWMDY